MVRACHAYSTILFPKEVKGHGEHMLQSPLAVGDPVNNGARWECRTRSSWWLTVASVMGGPSIDH